MAIIRVIIFVVSIDFVSVMASYYGSVTVALQILLKPATRQVLSRVRS